MATAVHCDVINAEAEIFLGLVETVIAHGTLGGLGVAPGRAPLITDLRPGPTRLVKQGGEQEVYYISGSFLEAQSNMIKILVDTVVCAGDLDEAAIQEVLKTVEKALQGKGAEFNYSAAATRLVEAAAQLRAVQQLRKEFGG